MALEGKQVHRLLLQLVEPRLAALAGRLEDMRDRSSDRVGAVHAVQNQRQRNCRRTGDHVHRAVRDTVVRRLDHRGAQTGAGILLSRVCQIDQRRLDLQRKHGARRFGQARKNHRLRVA